MNHLELTARLQNILIELLPGTSSIRAVKYIASKWALDVAEEQEKEERESRLISQ